MGRSEPLAGVVGAVHTIGAAWFGCRLGLPAGISGCFRFAVDWLAGSDVVTGLSQAVRNVVGRREMR
jgi:hypothetical protein